MDVDFQTLDECPLCGSKEILEYYRMPYVGSDVERYIISYYKLAHLDQAAAYGSIFNGTDYILASCKNCSLLFQMNRPGKNLSKLVYDTWIGGKVVNNDNFSRYDLNECQHNISEALRLVRLVERSTGKRTLSEINALDYGMGNGQFCRALQACLVDTYGSEYAQDRIEFGRRSGIKTMNVEDDLPPDSFDLINTEQVMEHVPPLCHTSCPLV